ncbi:MAG: DNA translocase FtsK [Oscillospiraceae bacterium]|nr:DNA translocase FtsK [Oscillospiraceae bacterium]
MPKSSSSARTAQPRGGATRPVDQSGSKGAHQRASNKSSGKALAKTSVPMVVKPPKKTRPEAVFVRGALGVLVIGAGLILFCSLIWSAPTGFLQAVRAAIQGSMGRFAFWFPLIVIWTGALVAFSAKNPVRMSTVLLIAALVVCVTAIAQVTQFKTVASFVRNYLIPLNYREFIKESYKYSAVTPHGGGALGALIAYPLTIALAEWGANILLVCLMLADFLMLFKVSVPALGDKMWAWMSKRWGGVRVWAEDRWSVWRMRRGEGDAAVSASYGIYPPGIADGGELAPYNQDNGGDSFAADGDQGSSAQYPAPPAKPRVPSRDDAGNRGRVIPLRPSPERRIQQPIEPIHASGEPTAKPVRMNDPNAAKRLFIEDIVPDGTTLPTALPHKRQPGELPSYLDEQRKRYDELDVIPEGGVGTQDGIDSDGEEDAPPWEPLPRVDIEGIDLEPASFAQPAMVQAAPPAVSGRSVGDVFNQSAPTSQNAPPDRHDAVPEPDSFKRYPEPFLSDDKYRTPPFELLNRGKPESPQDTRSVDQRNSLKLEETLTSFGLTAKVVHVTHGPAITRYEVQPGPGIKVARIVSLTDDIALNMAALGVRIEAPIPGKSAVGIEIPNENVSTVLLRDVLESDESQNHPSKLAIALGKDIAGKRIIANLSSMPHLLIAGATGSGKSVCINTIITSLIYRATPQEVRLILVDPKVVELSVYNGIPHLEAPVVTDPKEAAKALKWAVIEMEDRYRKFAAREVRDIRGFNAKRAQGDPLMPQIVVVIDELADLMLVASKDVEESICRLAQLARAAGIHLVIATQRPSVNVITGVIKSNIPSRIAFAVASQVDARTILDTAGAEKLIGRGDMLYAPSGGGKPLRVQGCFVSDQEVARVVDYVKQRHEPEYSSSVIDYLANEGDESSVDEDLNDATIDELLKEAAEMVIESGQASISMLQRRLKVGYARAGRLIDEMSRRGIIAQSEGSKPRDVLISADEFKRMFPKR